MVKCPDIARITYNTAAKKTFPPFSMQSKRVEFSKVCLLTIKEILMHPDDFSNESLGICAILPNM